ncbi:hypothetical protein F511_38210 [Dorcoceras hygrometricum]|uniref:Uncharacterized protein n=1 Tax=Dorcoceras hygrometricum TaxID=472368 RepID=A0A2Z7DCF3_9LAMI|nr:hypothetical protein F511_38210 [Dorcoceras hygrometricum]
MLSTLSSVYVRESRIQYLCDPQWFRDIASRGPTTIVAPESQFRTFPSDHVAIQEAKKDRKLELELERRRSAEALSVDDISSDVIIQKEATIQQENFALIFQQKNQSQRKEFQTQCFDQQDASNSSIQSRAYLNQLLLYIQSQDTVSSHKKSRRKELKKEKSAAVVVIKSAAKQLTNYQRWMSTTELNSNGESDKKPAKEKDTISHTAAAVVHLRSLGVVTTAGCGIGSVHAVVRSNLLVEPSEERRRRSAAAIFVQQIGSQYIDSAVGLVFMEWAAGLAMETSRVDSVVRNQAEAKLNQLEHDEPAETMTTSCNADDISSDVIIQQEATVISRKIQQMRRGARYGMSCDDISLDVITISRWLSADEQSKLQWIQLQRKDFQTQCLSNQTQEDKSIVAEEDSGEAIDQPDASNSSIQSRAYLNQLLLYIQSRATVSSRKKSRRKELKEEQSESVDDLRKMNVNC